MSDELHGPALLETVSPAPELVRWYPNWYPMTTLTSDQQRTPDDP